MELAGRPLISHPLTVLADAGIEAIVVAKPDSPLPPDLPVPIVTEPPEPRHPLLGIATALEHAGGRPVLACACDMPFVTRDLLARLAGSPPPAAAHDGTRLHPTLALYQPAALPALRDAIGAGASATDALRTLGPTPVSATPRETFNVNTPEDLTRAEELLAGGV